MTIIRSAIRSPVTTAVGVILLVMFGAIAIVRLPVQLTPDVEDPVITVTTVWPGASPREIEREIVQEQEDQLKSVEGLQRMKSECSDGSGSIRLEFAVGTDLQGALLRVSNRLEQVPEYPADADKPVITSTDQTGTAIAWFILLPAEENPYPEPIWTLFDFVDDHVKPEFERVPGVAASQIFGGRERELRVYVDPAELAARQVTIAEVAVALDAENRDYSGGDFDEGKRRYIVRTVGEYGSPADVESIVVAVRDGVPVYLRDVGRAELGFRKATARVFNRGVPILAVNASKEPGSNILEVMAGLEDVVRRLNEGRLAELGVRLSQVYDETEYIVSAIDLVQQSLLIGGVLAILTLLVYLRSATSTLVIAIAIPISIVGAFLAMYVFGRTLNVISLAGMAFAVGMVVDNSIVVLENIYRHRQMGKPRAAAALDGAREVWGAVLASTLTTIAVFVPVIFMEEEVGQLFGDIALAISFAVALSLIVSITVIPALSAKILGTERGTRSRARGAGPVGGVHAAARRVNEAVSDGVYRLLGRTSARVAVVVGFTAVAVVLGAWLMPKREYLPAGNQNFLFGLMLPPPGYSLEEMVRVEESMTDDLRHLWEDVEPGTPEALALPGGGIENYFFVALPNFAFMGGRSNEPLRTAELIPEFQAAASDIPGVIFVMNQPSLFERGRGEGRNVDVEITGPELERLIAIGGRVFGQVMQLLPDAQARPIPSLDLGNPEVRVETDRLRAAELGLTNRQLGFAVNALVDGVQVSDYRYEGREIDLRLLVEETDAYRTHLLEQLPIATPRGRLVTLGSLGTVSVVNGPVQINRTERERAITIQVTPAATTPLEQAMDTIQSEIVAPLVASGEISGLYDIRLSGSADKLRQTLQTVRWDLLLALAITYLLMAALFESFLYPVVIMFSVPLAGLGGVLGLWAVNLLPGVNQPLDVLTMLGFVILIGTVVNNAILIVHQSLNHMRDEGLPSRDAIREAVRNRMRPIFMSVSTSVLGMLPLVLFPGAGSELYRGLGSVVVGGLLVSAAFTLVLVPSLFSLVLDAREALAARVGFLDSERSGAPSG